MATLTKDERRQNRKHVLLALNEETGGQGGSAASARVIAYCNDPIGASTEEFGYVGGLRLRRWYIADDKPNAAERASLWQNLKQKFGKPAATDPGGWDGTSDVKKLQAIMEEA
jgi:hypothetical protein